MPQRPRHKRQRKKLKDELGLEATLVKNGRTMRRCQAISRRTGQQCTQPARRGYEVCHMHGAGTRKRVQKGLRQDPRAAGATRLYDQSEAERISEYAELVEALRADLDDSDPEMVQLKAIAWYLKGQEGRIREAEAVLERAKPMMEAAVQQIEQSPDLETILVVRNAASDVGRALMLLERYSDRLTNNLLKIISAQKMRAEIRAKGAEAKALEIFLERTEQLKGILLELLPPEQYDVFYQRLRVEVLKGLPQP